MLTKLIDKTDTFELIGTQIALILAQETENQQQLADAAGKDPDLWKFDVFLERADPWSRWQNKDADPTPIVNIFFDNDALDPTASNTAEVQRMRGIFNIDCYGYGVSRSDGSGHIAGDKLAVQNSQRILRLVRNILMSAEYNLLGLQGLVAKRMPQSRTAFQPRLDNQNMQHVQANRLLLAVDFIETNPQADEPGTVQLITTEWSLDEAGQVKINANIEFN